MQIKLNRADVIAIDTMLKELKGAYPRVIYRSINKTLGVTKTEATKQIASVLNLTSTRIKKDFKLIKASSGNLQGSVIAKGNPVNLATFKGTSQTQKGISVRIFVNGERHTLKHAFIWKRPKKTGGEAKTAFWRSKIYGRPYRQNFPYDALSFIWPEMRGTKEVGGPGLETLTGPRIEDIYGKPEIIDDVLIFGGNKYVENVDRYLSYEMSKL